MDSTQALKILDQLYSGINPLTGQPFPPDSPYNNLTIVRALGQIKVLLATPAPTQTVAEAREKGWEAKRKPGLSNMGKRWTQEHKQQLTTMFQYGTAVEEIARQFERTPRAIAAQLAEMGALPENSELIKQYNLTACRREPQQPANPQLNQFLAGQVPQYTGQAPQPPTVGIMQPLLPGQVRL
jgi:transposase-like protein